MAEMSRCAITSKRVGAPESFSDQPSKNALFVTAARFLKLSPPASADLTIATATDHAPPDTRVFIVPLCGAVSRIASGETAFRLRQPGYELDIMGRWVDAARKTNAVRWVEALREKLQPLAHGMYANQLGETSEDLVRAAYGPNYTRLVEIKRKYDPENVLRINQNIKPS